MIGERIPGGGPKLGEERTGNFFLRNKGTQRKGSKTRWSPNERGLTSVDAKGGEEIGLCSAKQPRGGSH